jgi:thiol-disulfide isomerase/thioredoxin
MNKNTLFYILLVAAIAFGIFQYNKYRVVASLDFKSLKTFDLDGNEYELFPNNEKYAYIVFWGTWCRPCVNEMPIIQNVYNQLEKPSKWSFVTIAEEPVEKISQFKNRKKLSFPFTISEKEFAEYNIFTYPTSYIINNKYEILESWTGEVNSEEELIILLSKYE